MKGLIFLTNCIMNKKFMNFLLDLVVKVRGVIEPLTWKLFSLKNWESLED